VSDGGTIKDVLERLTAEKPALNDKLWTQDHQLTGFIHIFVNGRAIQYLDGLDTPVADTDIISLFPPVGGG
jgi:molybdopterin synthase sulfur carrier subunit